MCLWVDGNVLSEKLEPLLLTALLTALGRVNLKSQGQSAGPTRGSGLDRR